MSVAALATLIPARRAPGGGSLVALRADSVRQGAVIVAAPCCGLLRLGGAELVVGVGQIARDRVRRLVLDLVTMDEVKHLTVPHDRDRR